MLGHCDPNLEIFLLTLQWGHPHLSICWNGSSVLRIRLSWSWADPGGWEPIAAGAPCSVAAVGCRVTWDRCQPATNVQGILGNLVHPGTSWYILVSNVSIKTKFHEIPSCIVPSGSWKVVKSKSLQGPSQEALQDFGPCKKTVDSFPCVALSH